MTAARRAGNGATDAAMTRAARRYYTAQQLSDLIAVPIATLTDWRYKGEGPVWHKFGRHVRYAVDDVDDYLTRARVAH